MSGSLHFYFDSYFFYSPTVRVPRIKEYVRKYVNARAGDGQLAIVFIRDIIKASYIANMLKYAVNGTGGVGKAIVFAHERCRRRGSVSFTRIAKSVGEEEAFFSEFITFLAGSEKDPAELIRHLRSNQCPRTRIVLSRERCRALGRLVRLDPTPLQTYLGSTGSVRLLDVFREYSLCKLKILLGLKRAPVAEISLGHTKIRDSDIVAFLSTHARECISACSLGKHKDDVLLAMVLIQWLTLSTGSKLVVGTLYSAGVVEEPEKECFSCLVKYIDTLSDLRG